MMLLLAEGNARHKDDAVLGKPRMYILGSDSGAVLHGRRYPSTLAIFVFPSRA